MKKKALAIITCDRPDFLKKCISSIPKDLELIIVNDGNPVTADCPIIQTNRIGVGAAKNKALSYFHEKGIDHIFIMEEDILVKDPSVFDTYIKRAEENNIYHLNYGLSSRKNPLLKTENGLNLYKNPYAGFSYFHRHVIDEVGLFDERFYNALEHIDYTFRITLKNMHTPLPYYADILDSHLYLENIEEDFKGSIIRKDYPLFKKWLKAAILVFIDKWGVHPAKLPHENPPKLQSSQTLNN